MTDEEDKPVDLQDLWDRMEESNFAGPMPTVGVVPETDTRLFYPGLSAIAGPSSVGKTMFTQVVGVQVIKEGLCWVVLDSETGDHPENYLYRLRLLGATKEDLERVIYFNWTTGLIPEKSIETALAGRTAGYVTVDSLSNAMAILGLDDNSTRDTNQWHMEMREVLNRCVGPQAATVLIDGLPKGSFVPGQDARGGIGSGRKLYQVEIYYRLYSGEHGSKEAEGWSYLVCTKDKHGNYAEGSRVAELYFGPSGVGLRAPTTRTVSAAEKRQAKVDAERDNIIDQLWDVNHLPRAPFEASVYSREALKALIAEGVVLERQVPTGGRPLNVVSLDKSGFVTFPPVE